MNNLLYVSFEDSENLASGVNKKIIGQIKAFEAAEFSVDLIAHYKDNIAYYQKMALPKEIVSKIPWRIALCGWAERHAADYDIVYIRFQFFCPFVLRMVQAFHRENAKVIMEIPTYPYVTELKKQGARGIPKRIIDGCFRKACAKYIDCFAAPLYSEPIMGKKCIEIRNGINVDDIEPRKKHIVDNKIHLLAVAMMAPWHGYDRMISGISEYYHNGGKEDIVLHLVGQGVESNKYEKMISDCGLSEHVIQHGKLFGNELNDLYDCAHIGVGSLGVHRTDITKTNTLKILEYFAKGLPVICESSEIGIDIDNPYRLTVPSDENPINMEEVVRFYQRIYQGHELETIIRDIRGECRLKCSIKSGLNEILEYMRDSK